MYISSSIGNFSPKQARTILRNLRSELRPGDALLLGTDMVKDEATLVRMTIEMASPPRSI
jgi:L-histidine N-alpha-methyltransferase